jgi:hypothetical protein
MLPLSRDFPAPSSGLWWMPSGRYPIAPYLQHVGIIAEI